MMTKPKIAVIHPYLLAGGGSEAVALWILTALQDASQLSLITMGPVDLLLLNDAYGTTVRSDRVNIISLPLPRWLRNKFDALRTVKVTRFCREHADEYDLMISAYNVMDFGKKGIQFIGDFSFDDDVRRELHPAPSGTKRWLYQRSIARSVYLGVSKRLAGGHPEGWSENLTVSNSQWTRAIVRQNYGIESEVVYPPLPSIYPDTTWEDKENGFVCLGRLVPEKGTRMALDIISAVRACGWDVHLHIAGTEGDPSYSKSIKEFCRDHQDWAFFEGPVFGKAKKNLLAGHKFSISACRNEAFGIAIAESAGNGDIVWVPQGGGQVEIVGRPDLIYEDELDAVAKIVRVLRDPGLQTRLRDHLSGGMSRFSSGRFIGEVRRLVASFLSLEVFLPEVQGEGRS